MKYGLNVDRFKSYYIAYYIIIIGSQRGRDFCAKCTYAREEPYTNRISDSERMRSGVFVEIKRKPLSRWNDHYPQMNGEYYLPTRRSSLFFFFFFFLLSKRVCVFDVLPKSCASY